MSRRSKRASMREGPLADLFRSTSDDAPEESAEGSGAQPAGPVAGEIRVRQTLDPLPSRLTTSGRDPLRKALRDRGSRLRSG